MIFKKRIIPHSIWYDLSTGRTIKQKSKKDGGFKITSGGLENCSIVTSSLIDLSNVTKVPEASTTLEIEL